MTRSIESCHTTRSRYRRTGPYVRLAAVVAIAEPETRSRKPPHHSYAGWSVWTRPDSRLLAPDSVFLTSVPELVDLVLRQAAAAVPLLGPRIAVHVIAVLLPKARQILV